MGRTPKGHMHQGRLRIVCDLDPVDFQRIAALDLPDCKSMASKIRLLIEWGLMALDDEGNPQ